MAPVQRLESQPVRAAPRFDGLGPSPVAQRSFPRTFCRASWASCHRLLSWEEWRPPSRGTDPLAAEPAGSGPQAQRSRGCPLTSHHRGATRRWCAWSSEGSEARLRYHARALSSQAKRASSPFRSTAMAQDEPEAAACYSSYFLYMLQSHDMLRWGCLGGKKRFGCHRRRATNEETTRGCPTLRRHGNA